MIPLFPLQTCRKHPFFSCLNGQGLPPFLGTCKTTRRRFMMPMPHSSEHLDHADQGETIQSREPWKQQQEGNMLAEEIQK